MRLAGITLTALVASILAGCGSAGTPTLSQSQQSTLGGAIGLAVVRCTLGSNPSSNTFDDPQISSDLNQVAGLYKKLGPHARLGKGSKEDLGQAVRKMIPQLSCAPALSQILITATGGSPNAAANASRQLAQAQYQKCNTQLSSLVSAESDLDSHLSVGLNYHDYTNTVGNVRAAYNQIDIHAMDQQCLSVGAHLETAMNDYAKAAATWTTCFNDVNCSNSSIQPQLQAQWSKASGELQQAKSALQDLGNPSTTAATPPATPTSPPTSPSTSPTTTQSTLPQPSPGATGPPANSSASTLPAWLGGGPIPQYWALCGSGSQEVVTNGACGLAVRQVFVAALAASGHPPRQIMDQHSNTYTCQRWRRPGVWRCTNTHGVWAAFTAP